MSGYDFDLLVIGSGPAGQRAAVQATKLGKRVALVERSRAIGGVSVHTGTIPSKTLREAALYLTGYRERALYGASYSVKEHITMGDLLFHADHVVRNEIEVIRHQMTRNGVELFMASASFVDAHTLRLEGHDGSGERVVSAPYIVIATGSLATRDPHVPFDGYRVLTSDDILAMQHLPRSLTIVGAGVIGTEYAGMFAALGVRVTLIDQRDRLLPVVDHEIADELAHQLRKNRLTLRLGETVQKIEIVEDGRPEQVIVHLASGKHIAAECLLYSIGRSGATAGLNLAAAGLAADERGRLCVNEHLQTAAPHIYAAGDIIGFPALASTSMEQGRMAACHAFGARTRAGEASLPYAIYTVPEVSMVGPTEQELTEQQIPYEVGKAAYREIARGQIIGDESGLLKLLFHAETRRLLGVHIMGAGAGELVHIGKAVLDFGGDIDYFLDAVFNYPTLAECYKTAALDAANRFAATASVVGGASDRGENVVPFRRAS